MTHPNTKAGHTLVEMLLSMAITLIIVTFLSQTAIETQRAVSTATSVSEISRRTRDTLSALETDLRQIAPQTDKPSFAIQSGNQIFLIINRNSNDTDPGQYRTAIWFVASHKETPSDPSRPALFRRQLNGPATDSLLTSADPISTAFSSLTPNTDDELILPRLYQFKLEAHYTETTPNPETQDDSPPSYTRTVKTTADWTDRLPPLALGVTLGMVSPSQSTSYDTRGWSDPTPDNETDDKGVTRLNTLLPL